MGRKEKQAAREEQTLHSVRWEDQWEVPENRPVKSFKTRKGKHLLPLQYHSRSSSVATNHTPPTESSFLWESSDGSSSVFWNRSVHR